MRMRLILDVDYGGSAITEEQARACLERLPNLAAGEGLMSGGTDGEVESWEARVERVGAEAVRVPDRILVRAAYAMGMVRVVETDCPDHDAFSALPKVVEMGGIVYGLTGWDSDRGVAFYRNDARTASRKGGGR